VARFIDVDIEKKGGEEFQQAKQVKQIKIGY